VWLQASIPSLRGLCEKVSIKEREARIPTQSWHLYPTHHQTIYIAYIYEYNNILVYIAYILHMYAAPGQMDESEIE
jgi:hypothetical protein